jgi:hypothetical protein
MPSLGDTRERSANALASDASPAGRLARRAWLSAAIAIGAGFALSPRSLLAARPDEADTSTQARDEAIRALPLDQLSAESRRKVMAVCESPSIFRRLPNNSVPCDADLHRFLIRNPEVVVNIWQLMGVSNMTAERVGDYLWKGNDGTGTTCDVELIYGTDDLHLLYGDGFYEGALLKRKITGRCVLLMQSGYGEDTARRPLVANRLDIFLQIDNAGADMIARTLAPWVGKVADSNFSESCKFASKISQTAEQNGPGMQRLADKLTQVQPQVRDQFARVSTGVQQRAALRGAGDLPRRR